VKHVHYYWFQLTEERLTQKMFCRHAANDHGAAAATRLGTRGRGPSNRLKVIQWRHVLVMKLGWRLQKDKRGLRNGQIEPRDDPEEDIVL
jgi:hypothetical protein